GGGGAGRPERPRQTPLGLRPRLAVRQGARAVTPPAQHFSDFLSQSCRRFRIDGRQLIRGASAMKPAADVVESILAAAVEMQSEEERRQFVDQACGTDAELKRRIEELIGNHFQAGSFLESVDPEPVPTVAD